MVVGRGSYDGGEGLMAPNCIFTAMVWYVVLKIGTLYHLCLGRYFDVICCLGCLGLQ